MRGFFLAFSATFSLWACAGNKSLNKFSNDVLIEIATYQDRRLGDSVYHYLNSKDPRIRSAAALAFGSIQDTAASTSLGNLLLEDKVADVRENAAFALGQTPCIASVNALIPALEDSDSQVVCEVLESLGKTLPENDINVLKTYTPTDSMTREGLAWAFYRLGIRGLADSVIIVRSAEFLNKNNSLQTRLGAAHFFSRASIIGKDFEKNLIETALHDPSTEVRIAAVNGLRKLKDDSAFAALKLILASEKDYRIRINGARALQGFSLDKTKPLFLELLKDRDAQVGIATSEALISVLKEPWPEILDLARHATNWRIQANLYQIYLTVSPSKDIENEITSKYKASNNVYQKAWLLGSLSQSVETYSFLQNELMMSGIFVIQTSAAEGLVAINRNRKFPTTRTVEFAEIYKQAIAAGDPAVTGIVCQALADPTLGYKTVFKNIDFLKNAKQKLSLPKDIESLQPLDDAIAYLEGKGKATPLKNRFDHPIDWEKVRRIAKSQRVLVRTSKGDIIIRLLVDEAPGSVANFVDLIEKKYFDKKFFHRVVPNFVIQTGCYRGDGFGSEDYSIRSEFSRRNFTTGTVGMASAGKDTEGTQWFITHSPAPHLDGRYTIFAEVERGMDTVHKIEMGDQINVISLIHN